MRKVSFRDKVISGGEKMMHRIEGDLLQQKLAQIYFEEGDMTRPRVFFEDFIVEEVSIAWRDALVIKLLGKSLGFVIIREKVKAMWSLRGGL